MAVEGGPGRKKPSTCALEIEPISSLSKPFVPGFSPHRSVAGACAGFFGPVCQWDDGSPTGWPSRQLMYAETGSWGRPPAAAGDPARFAVQSADDSVGGVRPERKGLHGASMSPCGR